MEIDLLSLFIGIFSNSGALSLILDDMYGIVSLNLNINIIPITM